jgi:predicted phosphohydrolase
MTKTTPDEINKMNADFWDVESKKLKERLKDPALRNAAMARLKSEALRGVRVHDQLTLDGALAEEEQMALKNAGHIEKRVISARARRAASMEKVDALQSFINLAVEQKPSIQVPELLDKVRAEAGSGGRIQEVVEGSIWFVGTHDKSRKSRISGLKDRLWRAKQKLKSKD